MPSTRGSLGEGQPLTRVPIAPGFGDGNFTAGDYGALIDTGSTKTCITRTVVEQLRPSAYSKILLATPSGLERRKAHAFSVGFFNEGDGDLAAPRSPFYFPDAITGADFVKNSNFDVLLGMDILSRGRLLIENRECSFSF